MQGRRGAGRGVGVSSEGAGRRHARRKTRGMPPPATFDIDTLPGSAHLTAREAAAVIRRTPGALEQWRRDPNHPLKWRSVTAVHSIVSMQCATIWRNPTRPLRRPIRTMVAETAEQFGLDPVEWIGPLQAHDLTKPLDIVLCALQRGTATKAWCASLGADRRSERPAQPHSRRRRPQLRAPGQRDCCQRWARKAVHRRRRKSPSRGSQPRAGTSSVFSAS